MFSFFKKKSGPPDAAREPAPAPAEPPAADAPPAPETERRSWLDRLRGVPAPEPAPPAEASPATTAPALPPVPRPEPSPEAVAGGPMVLHAPDEAAPDVALEADRRGWIDKLRGGLRKTGSSIAQVFTGAQIDDALYEELETALLMADAGVKATAFLLDDLKRRVRQAKASTPQAVKALLADAIADLLAPLQRPLQVGEHVPTVIMVVGVNGAGKTTSIGKLTRHLADANQKVLLAAADTFRAAAREQLAVWAGRADGRGVGAPVGDRVEIIGQEGGDPAAVTFDAVVAGKARGCDVVIADTAGRLTTQLHLMDELKKIRRVIAKAQHGAPHEVLLVLDGNTGQNALAQVQTFDAALQLTGLIITKLDGTAKGGVLAAIALWSRERARGGAPALPVYFVGVGEKLEDLQTFSAREFAQALLN
jgi:fused signal recognition particle receptor